MVNIEDKLKEIVKYTNENTFKYWILISYKESIWRGQTFKEAILINIKELKYNKENIFRKDNLKVCVEIEEIRTINFPIGSIVDSFGNLILTSNQSFSIKNVYSNTVLIDPYKDVIAPFDNAETFDTDFIDGVPCYYKRFVKKVEIGKENPSSITYIIPVHPILDFFFYTNTRVTNILTNDFESIFHLIKKEPDILLYPSTIINEDSAKFIGKYFFTKYSAGRKALMKINEHHSEWINQAKNKEQSKAYINTSLPFGIKTNLNVNGIYLTDFNSNEKKFLVLSILDARPLDNEKSFFEIKKINLFDLTDKRSTDSRESKPEVKYDKKTIQEGWEDQVKSKELSDEPVNNSLPEVENDIINSRKFNSDLEFEKAPRLDQLNKYFNEYLFKDIEKLSINYNEQNGNSKTARYQAIEEESFSFFKVFFKAIELLEKNRYSISYLTLSDKDVNPRLTIAPSGLETKIRLRSLVISICQIKNENYGNYILIESGENKHIGMFRCTNNNSFNLVGDIRIKSFLEKVINVHDYNWSKVNSKENSNFQSQENIRIFRPIEHEITKLNSLRKVGKTDTDIIYILASTLAYKIEGRIFKNAKEKV
ncbi:hypothetical protein FNW52_12655 [Flavobacterium sp. ZT3R18]|uniref:hypothetical protein n=1 Tax=Flavobacterium sp. ZT3R18 TaxID=2594429 RepID=UPI00117AF107|nr:hypothetical protein [Flavobacterium sp. ZT3R18]TRX34985.1 hypothetical protein FNW52_12655 [Flavobacterium sp. ZT3R18]